MRRSVARAALAALVVAVISAAPLAAPADEIDDLAKKLNLAPKFHGYKPKFHYSQKTFTIPGPKGDQTVVLRIIQDEDKYVALIADDFIELLEFSPLTAKPAFTMRTGRYGPDNLRGPTIPTGDFLGGSRKVRYTRTAPGIPPTDHFREGGSSMELVRAVDNAQIKVVSKYEFLVHDVFGYMVQGTTSVQFKPQPPPKNKDKLKAGAEAANEKPKEERFSYTSIFCPETYVPWTTRWTYDRTVFCPAGSTDWLGWANNTVAIAHAAAGTGSAPLTWRDGGFVAFLNAKTDQAVCRTRSDGGLSGQMTLDGRDQFHVAIPLPEDLPKDKAERESYSAVQRLFALPPEAGKHIRQNMKLMELGLPAIICRIGEKEDFENQPVPLTEAVRGLAWTTNPPTISTQEAFAGKQSLLIRGQHQMNDPFVVSHPDTPPVPLRPAAKYRLEAMLKVENMTESDRLAFRQAYDVLLTRIDAETAKIKDADKKTPIPAYNGPKPVAEAFLTANLFADDPDAKARPVTRQQTTSAKGDKPGWQKVTLEFTTPAWDPYVDISFVVDSGQAFVDDFSLMRVD
jgi:hypothetical protein